MSDAFWFKPKSHGYGASPSNWKGWVAILAFVVVVFAFTFPMMVMPALSGGEPTFVGSGLWLAVLVVATLAFIYLCKSKTDGAWRWRWGETDDTGGE